MHLNTRYPCTGSKQTIPSPCSTDHERYTVLAAPNLQCMIRTVLSVRIDI